MEVPITFSDLGNRQYLYLTDKDLDSEHKIILKVMTDNPNQSVERLELGHYELKLNTLRYELKLAKENAETSNSSTQVG